MLVFVWLGSGEEAGDLKPSVYDMSHIKYATAPYPFWLGPFLSKCGMLHGMCYRLWLHGRLCHLSVFA